MAKIGKPNAISERWRIVSMSTGENEYLDEEIEAFFEFEGRGGGSIQFGYVQGVLDWRLSKREGKPAVEFSWEGGDGADGTPLTGCGWAKNKSRAVLEAGNDDVFTMAAQAFNSCTRYW